MRTELVSDLKKILDTGLLLPKEKEVLREAVFELERAAAIVPVYVSLDFRTLAKANDERSKMWEKASGKVPLLFSLCELAGEAGEACNIGKKIARTQLGLRGGTTDIEPLKEEVADVVICADLVARNVGFDLGEAVVKKFNDISRKHGFNVKLPEKP